MKTKKSNLQPKILSEMQPGYVRAEMVKCGKLNCKCARGKLHGPYFYHFTWCQGQRSKWYVKRADVAQIRAACQAYRDLQAELREGRRNYSLLLQQAKAILRLYPS